MSSNLPTESVTEPRPRQRGSGIGPRTLTSRLVVTSTALVAVVCVLVAGLSTIAMRTYLMDRLDDQLNDTAQRASRGFGAIEPAGPEPDRFRSVCQTNPDRVQRAPGSLTGSLDPDCTAVLATSSSGFGATTVSSSAIATLREVPADGRPYTVNVDGEGDYRVVVTNDGGHTVVTGQSTDDVEETISRLVGLAGGIALIGVLGAGIAALFLVRRQLSPLHQIAATAQSVATMPLSSGAVDDIPRVPGSLTDPGTEVGQVGAAFNAMLGHVEQSLTDRHDSEQQVRQFLADASHELRTPLTTIQGYAELTRRPDMASLESLQRAMGKVQVESARMATLVEDMMLLARLDAGRPLEAIELDVGHLVLEAVNDARVVDRDRRYQVRLPDTPVLLIADQHRLHQVVSNLLGNARRHTPAGTTISVAAHADAHGVELTVHDDGPGLPESLRGREFERFTRGDTSRTRDGNGVGEHAGAGLGLSIVRAIVSAHGGDVTVVSRAGDTTFTIKLPTAT